MSDIQTRYSRTHPGWKVFVLAWLSGIFTMATAIYVTIHADWSFVWSAGIAIALFLVGGSNAENLTDRKK